MSPTHSVLLELLQRAICRKEFVVEEDEIGVQRAIGHNDYVECLRCGRLTPKETAEVIPGNALETQSEFEFLCGACRYALAEGEQDLALPQP